MGTLKITITKGIYFELSEQGRDEIKISFPSIGGSQIQSDWNELNTESKAFIKNKPNIGGDGGLVQEQSDWNTTDTNSVTFVKNKPTIPASQVQTDWNATVGLGVLLNKPTIPSAQIQPDWEANSGLGVILNKPTIPNASNAATAYSHSQSAHAPSSAQANADITKAEIEAKLTGSISSHSHSVTKSDIGLGNADNTSDTNKPVSSATQTALNAKQATLVNQTNIKSVNGVSLLGSGDLTVGGGGGGDMYKANYDPQAKNADAFSVDNHSDGTTNKVYSVTDKTKLAGIATGAQVNSTITKAEIEAKLTGAISSHSHSVSKSDVGLSNADNTSDASKPVSTAQQAALNSLAATIPAAQVQTDWNASSGLGVLLNKPTIPSTPTKVNATLTVAGWSGLSQTIAVTGVTTSNDIDIAAPISRAEFLAFGNAKISCTAQGTGTLTFVCDAAPTIDLNITVKIQN